MKNLDSIWQEYINQNFLSKQTLNDLIWYIDNNSKPEEAIVMAIDMLIEEPNNKVLMELIPYLVKQLDHEDDFIRELTVGCVVDRMKLSEYAEKALNMAKNDPYKNVRDNAAASLGSVIDNVDFNLRKQIAVFLYDVMINTDCSDLHKQSAYRSILKAMEVPFNLWPPQKLKPDITNIVDKKLLEKFKIKYTINNDAA